MEKAPTTGEAMPETDVKDVQPPEAAADDILPAVSVAGFRGGARVYLDRPANEIVSVDATLEVGGYVVTCPVVFPPGVVEHVIYVRKR